MQTRRNRGISPTSGRAGDEEEGFLLSGTVVILVLLGYDLGGSGAGCGLATGPCAAFEDLLYNTLMDPDGNTQPDRGENPLVNIQECCPIGYSQTGCDLREPQHPFCFFTYFGH